MPMSNLLGEYLGTMMLIILGNGVVATVLLTRSKGHGGGWICVTTGWGIAVMVGVFVAQAAGAPFADINPAVSLARFLLTHAYTLPQLICTQIVQVLGAFTGSVIVWLVYLKHWAVTEDPHMKLLAHCTSPAIWSLPANLLTEIIGTAVLVFAIGAIFGTASHPFPIAPGLGPYIVGVLVWGIGLSLGGPTGYAINPARDLGPRLAHAVLPIVGKGTSQWRYAWVPVIGPLVGSVIGALVWSCCLM